MYGNKSNKKWDELGEFIKDVAEQIKAQERHTYLIVMKSEWDDPQTLATKGEISHILSKSRYPLTTGIGLSLREVTCETERPLDPSLIAEIKKLRYVESMVEVKPVISMVNPNYQRY